MHILKNLCYKVVRAIPAPVRNPLHYYYRLADNFKAKVTGNIKGNAAAAYWFRGCINFGDLLTPALLQHYGYTPYFSGRARTGSGKNDIVCVGSILGHIHSDFSGIIFGSGFIREKDAKTFPKAKIIGLRGELSKQLAQCNDPVILGDPGLLSLRLISRNIEKKYRLGIVIHHAEWENRLHNGLFESGSDVLLIDPRRSPLLILREIAQCEHIVSSSLHGLIVADSFGIPNARILLSENLIIGGDFKFNDYYSALQTTRDKFVVTQPVSASFLVGLTVSPPMDSIRQRQEELHAAFCNLKTLLQ
jgi:hypothetical protein